MSATFASLLVELALKSTVLLGILLVIGGAMRWLSAGERHALWVCAFVGLLALPAVALLVPAIEMRLPQPVAAADFMGSTAEEAAVPVERHDPRATIAPPTEPGAAPGDDVSMADAAQWAPRSVDLALVATVAYGSVASLLLAYVCVCVLRVSASLRRLPPCRDRDALALLQEVRRSAGIARPVRLKISSSDVTPWAWGWLRPAIVLPEAFLQWPRQARRNTLLHEAAHIARFDFLTALVGYVCCAFYWFQPLSWLVLRRLNGDAERACDDRVLVGGGGRSAYAGQLLELAAAVQGEVGGQPFANAMARRSTVSRRITSILDLRTRRTTMGRLKALSSLILIAVIAAPIGALKSQGDTVSEEAGELHDPAFLALVERGPGDNEELALMVRTYMAGGMSDEAAAVIADYLWRHSYDPRQPLPGGTDVRCEFCRSVLATTGTAEPHAATSAMLAAFADVERRAVEVNDGNPLIGLATLARESGPGIGAGGRGLWYLLEGFRLGNLTNDSKMAAVSVLDTMGMHEQAKALLDQLRGDPTSSLYQSEELARWARYLETRINLVQQMGARLVAGAEGSVEVDGEFLPVHRVAPTYPAQARAAGLEGEVIVEFTVSERGRAEDVTVVSSTDAVFEEAAVRAASEAMYAPRLIAGVPVEVQGVRNLFRFVLEQGL